MLYEKRVDFKRHYPICKGIYGQDIETDFYLRNVNEFPIGLCLESKWQDSPGSVDEKFPYLVENIKKRYPCPAIIIQGGYGARDGAVEWLYNQVDEVKLIAVMDLQEFLSWVNHLTITRYIPKITEVSQK
jgi:hypothetical protein